MRRRGSCAGAPPRSCKAQATVEAAVVIPVLVVLALIVYNLGLFAAAVARFDRVAPDVVIAHAVSPAGAEGSDAGREGAAATVERELERAMEGMRVEVSVTREVAGASDDGSVLALVGALHTYRCEMRFDPWPGDFQIAGVRFGVPDILRHERSVTIDPWRPGVVV